MLIVYKIKYFLSFECSLYVEIFTPHEIFEIAFGNICLIVFERKFKC